MDGHDIFLPARIFRTFFLNTFFFGEDTFKRWVKREINKADAAEKNTPVENDKKNTMSTPLKVDLTCYLKYLVTTAENHQKRFMWNQFSTL